MSRVIFHNRNYCIYKVTNRDFIIHNKDKEFKDGHTHINNYNMAKIIIYACIKGKFPSRSLRLKNNKRVLESILRICSNKHYTTFDKMLFDLELQNKYTTPIE